MSPSHPTGPTNPAGPTSPTGRTHPQICGLWDGCNVWAQWTGQPGKTYIFSWRLKLGDTWSPWQPVKRKGGLQNTWLTFPTWRLGSEIQGRVAVWDGTPFAKIPEEAWELAQEVTFSKNRCRFLIAAERDPIALPVGTKIHAFVDGGPCSYVTLGAVQLQPGESAEVDCEAVQVGGYAQLDHAGHFSIRQGLGLTISNTGPSENDTQLTGRDFTVIARLPPGCVHVVFRRVFAQ